MRDATATEDMKKTYLKPLTTLVAEWGTQECILKDSLIVDPGEETDEGWVKEDGGMELPTVNVWDKEW